MRILHISSPKTWRGGEQQLLYLAEELKALGFHQVIMCPFNSAVHKYCLKKHINHVTYFKGFSANPMVGFRVSQICRKEKIDMIHVHDSHAHNFAILSAVLTQMELPIIVSRRVDFAVKDTGMSAYKYNHPQIAKIICVSNAIKEIMEPSIQDKSMLTVVHSGVDLQKFSKYKVTNKLRKEFEVPDDYMLIGNVAALAPHKDYFTFIRTAKRLVTSGLKAKFFAIGDGPMRKEVMEAIAAEGMKEHIYLTGFRDDIIDVLPELDLFLITSETEGLGTSILDALCAKVPVVATKAGGIIEIIEHEKNGLLADVADDETLAKQVLRLIHDETQKAEFVSAGLEKIKQFSKAETARKTIEVYSSALASFGESDLKA
ncbi:MAG: glycosyltransferase family 4 protein [Salibacteraceae bacterium]|nr:glycosyltransferase family 4 protein [Salibacteraceae bacterium]MDP4965958.1 glycosyltransferase family 4 protein [Salibacteraceae bacterium]